MVIAKRTPPRSRMDVRMQPCNNAYDQLGPSPNQTQPNQPSPAPKPRGIPFRAMFLIKRPKDAKPYMEGAQKKGCKRHEG